MSDKDRRISPRKDCAVPLRFRVLNDETEGTPEQVLVAGGNPPSRPSPGLAAGLAPALAPGAAMRAAKLEGEALNLSESGIYFTTREKLRVGSILEMYLALPRELTGRSPEEMRCHVRIVHVEERADARCPGFGGVVERFQPVVSARDWSN